MITTLTKALTVSMFCASALLLFGCSDNTEPVLTPDVESERFFKDGVILSPVAGEQTISFTTSENWMVSMAESADWCRVSPMSGTAGNASITISASENTGYDDRSEVITLTAGELEMTIAVTQKQTDAIIISRTSYVISSEARTIQVDLGSNIDHQVIIPEAGNWITQVSTTKALTDSKLQFSVQTNEGVNTRSGMIIIKDSKTTLADTVTVIQTGKSVVAAQGLTGDLKWTLFENGTLILTGNAPMPDYPRTAAPWADYRSLITAVIMENGVTSVGYHAFMDCGRLSYVMIPDGVTSIGSSAFYRCSSLTFITIPNSVRWINTYAFAFCSSLTSVMIPGSVIGIDWGVFNSCSGISELIVASDNPNYVSVNGVLFDKNQTTLVAYPGGKTGSYAIPGNVTSIKEEAFAYCSSLTAVTIPNSVTSIGMNAFECCAGLTAITIPNSVESIGNNAFWLCNSLASILIPTSVKYIGDGAFGYCINLSEIIVASDNPNYVSVNGVLFDKNQTTLVTCPGGKTGSYAIPNSVKTVRNYAFYYCSSLTSILIPSSVTTISGYAFIGCKLTSVTIDMETILPLIDWSNRIYLTSVTIGSTATSIRNSVFEGCSNLTEVHVKAITPPSLGYSVFLNTPASKKLYVPQGCKPAYQSSGWGGYFDTIIEE